MLFVKIGGCFAKTFRQPCTWFLNCFFFLFFMTEKGLFREQNCTGLHNSGTMSNWEIMLHSGYLFSQHVASLHI